MTNDGWIKLHRKMGEWEWYDHIPTFRVFMHLLIHANYADTKWRGYVVGRGEYMTSYRKLADETGLSLKQTRTAIGNLEKTGETSLKTARIGAHQFTIVTICNYDTYQKSDEAKGTPEGTRRAQEGHKKGTTMVKEGKEGKEEIPPVAPQGGKRKRFQKPSFEEWKSYGETLKPKLPIREARRTYDYYEANGWKVGRNPMKDWKASCRNCHSRWAEDNPSLNYSATDDDPAPDGWKQAHSDLLFANPSLNDLKTVPASMGWSAQTPRVKELIRKYLSK